MTLTATEILTHPGVLKVCERVARRVSSHRLIEYDDALQTAYELAASREAELVRKCLAGEAGCTLGTLYRRLADRLGDRCRTAERRARLTVSANHRYDDQREGYLPPWTGPKLAQPVETYDAELVAALLPSAWDWAHAWGVVTQNAADADMPRTAPDYSTSGTAWACRTDVGTARKCAGLTDDEDRAIFLVYGLDWTHEMAASVLGCHQTTVTRRVNSGLTKIVSAANSLGSRLHEARAPRRNVLCRSHVARSRSVRENTVRTSHRTPSRACGR